VPEAERDRWHRLDREPDAATLTELAWVACDGRRTVDEIARLVWLETGHYRPEAIAEFFAAASNLGLCARPDATEETCSPDAPGTASR
jgi:hypothetical protein